MLKGYKLLDIDTQIIFLSRDVIFYESIFPFHINTSLSHVSTDDTFVFPKATLDQFSSPASIPSVSNDVSTFPSIPIDIPISYPPVVLESPLVSSSTESFPSTDPPSIEPSSDNLIDPSVSIPDSHTSPIPSTLVPRHSTRPYKPPSYLKDYKCQSVVKPSARQSYDIDSHLTYSNHSPLYLAFVSAITHSTLEPTFYH